MPKIFLALFLLLPSLVLAQPHSAPAPLNVTEEDGSPSTYPYKVKFSNGTVTDNGDGTTSISNSGTGGGSGNVGLGTTGLVPVYVGSITVGPSSQVYIVGGNLGIGTSKVTNAALTVMNGNVGIGTWKPIAALEVKGHALFSDVASTQVAYGSENFNGITGNSQLIFSESLGSLIVGKPQGSTTGVINAGGDAVGGQINLSGTDDSVGMFTSMYGGSIGSLATVTINQHIGLWEGAGYNSSAAAFTRAGSIYLSADGEFGTSGDDSDSPGRWEFWTTPDGSSTNLERMVIKSTGNVGIGSIAPNSLLDVGGTALMTGFQLNQSPLAGGNVLVSTSTGIGTWMPPTTIGAGGSTNPGGSAPQLQYASNATTFGGIGSGGTDGTNIGIGTVSFVNRLNIVGNVGISTLTNSPFVTNTLASPGILIIEGNTGIGTWIPKSKLQVNNNFTFLSQITNSNTGIGTTTINWNSGNMQNIGLGTFQGTYLAFTDPTGGVNHVELKLIQDATGSRKIDFWPAKVKWVGATTPILSTTANAVDFLNCTYDGNYYCNVTTNYQ